MDLKTYFQLFWAPAVASAALMLLLWLREGGAPSLLAGWFLLAFVAQYLGTPSGVVWVAGLVLQTLLAVFLLLKLQMDQL